MITRNGEVKVTDLGIAQPLGSASIDDSLHANLPYMSPEQARQQELSAQSDLFSTGVILWEMLTGKSLFAGQNDFDTINNILTLAVQNPCDIHHELAPEIGQLTLRLLARDIQQRPKDCAEAARQLRALSQTGISPVFHPTRSSQYSLVVGIVLVVALLAGYLFFRS
ncbi:MAG TPA: hypothetical protein EYN66_20205 [Myxococcales bacterium]|nr:hypothetical protein [Myxococcales bacterium]